MEWSPIDIQVKFQVSMSTFNGFGTLFYGWQHKKDGTSVTTKWVVFFYIPVFPISRHHVKVLTNFNNEKFLTTSEHGFLAGTPAQITRYDMIENTPLNFREIANTYVKTFILGPILLLWPGLIFFGLTWLLKRNPEWKSHTWVVYVSVGVTVIMLANIIAVTMIALRRARGFQGGLFQ
jgi:hypothetical protein